MCVIESHGKKILNQRALREMQGEDSQKRRQAHTSLASENARLDHSLSISPLDELRRRLAILPKPKRVRLDSCRTFACCTQVIQSKEKRRSLWSQMDLKNEKKRVFFSSFLRITVMYKKLIPLADSTRWRIHANFYRLSEKVHFQTKRTTCTHQLTGFARGTPETRDSRGWCAASSTQPQSVLPRSKHRPSRSLHIANK